MVAIKDMEMPTNCISCQIGDNVPNCPCKGSTLIFDYHDKRHSNCSLVEIGTCKDCHNAVKNYGNGRIYCLFSNCIYDEDFWCKKFEKRGNEDE